MGSDSAQISVLIVEDVDAMQKLVEHVVGSIKGMKISGLAANGWQARMELARRRPDLVLLDEILPGESSYDLLAEFSAHNIPVLLMTGMKNPAHAVPQSARGRLTKPSWDTVDYDRIRFETAIKAVFSH